MDILNTIRSLKLNYATVDLQKVYVDLSKDMDLDSYLKYDQSRNSNFSGPFHLALSVKVFRDTAFIPFLSILNRDQKYWAETKEYIKDIVSNRVIKYNYTDLLTDLHTLMVENNICDEEHLSEIILQVEYDELHDRVNVCSAEIDIISNKSSLNSDIIDKINDLIRSKGDIHFLYLLSKFYHSQGERKLYYAFYSFDGDYSSNISLTQFVVITRHYEEVPIFFLSNVRKLRNLTSYLRTRYTYDLFEKGKVEAIKSAISAIMSRNMSHNLGSHYLYYTKAQLEKLSLELDDWGPNVRGASKVLGYIQARMDYLATVISNDKYPYGAVNFKSQIFDELTVDKFSRRHFGELNKSKRTTNYLLANLIRSENFTIPDIMNNMTPEGYSRLDLCVKYYNDETHQYDLFTGLDNDIDAEADVKNRLSNLYLALPGGIMSSHALFNVIENFIRNSAKYLQSDFQPTGLVFNILLKPSEDGRSIDMIIYDNKQNANRVLKKSASSCISLSANTDYTLYLSILEKLSKLRIINDENEIEKDSKGFKEMLFSSVWMKACDYKSSTYVDVITEINSEANPYKKLDLIEKYGFSLVQVYDPFNENKDSMEDDFDSEILRILNGDDAIEDNVNVLSESEDENIIIMSREDLSDSNRKSSFDKYKDNANLGIKLTLPLYNKNISFETIPNSVEGALKKNIETMLGVYSDIVCVDDEYRKEENKISHCFTRTYNGTMTKPVDMLREILAARFEDFDKYQFVFDNYTEYSPYDKPISELNRLNSVDRDEYERDRLLHRILFRRHLNAKEGIDFNNFSNYAYVDSVSGGNFTITINDLITGGLSDRGYVDEETEYFALKVKEAALTRITIIDERLYHSMHGHEAEYMVKNLRIMNYSKLEDDISYTINLVDNYSDGLVDAERLKLEIEIKLEEIAVYAARTLNALYNETEITKFFKDINLSVDDFESPDAFKLYLSDVILTKMCEISDESLALIFEGNYFKDNKNNTDFMSIHLGLIEKILKNSEYVNYLIDKRLGVTEKSYGRLDKERVELFMVMLKDLFNSRDLFISVHSGRGNFSKELEGPLAPYPFISLSALENAFNNSKYLLAQIFYNTVYIGKGLANS